MESITFIGMNKSALLIFLALALLSCSKEAKEKEMPLKIVFGSCSDQNQPEALWQEMANQKAQYALLLGDNVYADEMSLPELEAAYKMQKDMSGFQQLSKVSRIYGIWDDHDYGANDAGKYHRGKDSAQIAFLNFFNFDQNDPLRSQEGVNQSYNLQNADKTIKLILLDTRYFRDTLLADTVTNARYLPNTEGDILGENQWKWLEKELRQSNAQMHIIASSIQVVSWEHPFEKWSNFPKARKRLFDLIQTTKPSNAIFLSGDRHISEISGLTLPDYPTTLYDLTCSGLTHTWSEVWEESNQHRTGELIIKRNYGLLIIDWEKDKPSVTVRFKGHADSTFLTRRLEL